MKNKISLCMIVKNETYFLERSVRSVRSIVDEIVIVDTGSTDGTKDLARKLADTYAEFNWTGDFAAAKNHCLELARGQWILVLDGDECLAGNDPILLKEETEQTDATGLRLAIRNYSEDPTEIGWLQNDNKYKEMADLPGFHPTSLCRLFRNDRAHRYRGAVHELIEPSILDNGGSIAWSKAVIHHYGRIKESELGLSSSRYTDYLSSHLLKVEQEPENGKARYELAINYLKLGRHLEAERNFQDAIGLGFDHLDLWRHRLIALLNLNNPEHTQACIDRYIGQYGEDGYICLVDGLAALNKGDRSRAEQRLLSAIGFTDCGRNYQAHLALAEIYTNLDRFSESEEHLEQALAIQPGFHLGLLARAILEMRRKNYKKAKHWLDKIDPEAHPIVLKYLGGALNYLDDLGGAEDAFDRYVERIAFDAEGWFQLGLIALKRTKQPKALRCFEKASALNPKYTALVSGIVGNRKES